MGIDIDTLVKFNLKKDQILEPSDMQNIQEYDHYRRGVNLAIQYLSYKKRTEREVIQYLEKTIFKVMLFKMSLTIAIRKNLLIMKTTQKV